MKYIGCVLIMCGCIVLSHFYEIQEKNKISYLISMRDFILYIENKINLFLTPKHILFEEYKAEPIKSLMKNNFKELDRYFDKDITLFLEEFFNNFGQGLKDEQIKQCQYARGKIEETQKKAEIELKNKIKVFRTLSLFVGASLAILII